MEVLEAIKTRRSVRRYKPNSIDNQTIDTILEAACWTAPLGYPETEPGSTPGKKLAEIVFHVKYGCRP